MQILKKTIAFHHLHAVGLPPILQIRENLVSPDVAPQNREAYRPSSPRPTLLPPASVFRPIMGVVIANQIN